MLKAMRVKKLEVAYAVQQWKEGEWQTLEVFQTRQHADRVLSKLKKQNKGD